MFRKIRNLASYAWFVFSLDYFQLVSALIDIGILAYAITRWDEVVCQPTLILFAVALFVNFIWQVVNVASHFTFLKEAEPEKPLMSMLDRGDGIKDYSKIELDNNLSEIEMPYRRDSEEEGVLISDGMNEVICHSSLSIKPVMVETKRSNTKTYIRQYESVLLKFLNHKWHDVNQKGGEFTNDRKICLGSELVKEADGSCSWPICKGRYYNGVLTNFIYSRYVGGSYYRLYPPVNVDNTRVKPFGSSDFSDHIGVSTILVTVDKFLVITEQAANAGYNEGKKMPSGSGSLDYADYHEGEDFRQMIIRGAERELFQELSLEKKMKKGKWAKVETRILSYYRDLERGGKPEFCCVSFIDKKMEAIANDVIANKKELAKGSREFIPLKNAASKWAEILPKASLSLRMNYRALKEAGVIPYGEVIGDIE